MRRHELSDQQWERLEPLLPRRSPKGGPQYRNLRRTIHGMLWIFGTGAPWRDLPERYGPWQTVYHRFNQWRKEGTWDRIVAGLQAELDREGKIDWNLFCIDGSSIRASRAAAGARKGANPPRPIMP